MRRQIRYLVVLVIITATVAFVNSAIRRKSNALTPHFPNGMEVDRAKRSAKEIALDCVSFYKSQNRWPQSVSELHNLGLPQRNAPGFGDNAWYFQTMPDQRLKLSFGTNVTTGGLGWFACHAYLASNMDVNDELVWECFSW